MEWDKIRSIVAEELQIRAEEIHMDSRFSEDLGADSLNVYRIITEIADVFSVEVSDAFSDYNPQTVGALHNRVFDKENHRCYLKVTKKYYFEVDSMYKIGAFISGDTLNITDGSDIAANYDIENYNSIKDTFLSRNRTKFINKINDLYNTNVYKCEVIEKKEVKVERKAKQDREIILMERIEYLLTILEDSDKDSFNKYKEKYNEEK